MKIRKEVERFYDVIKKDNGTEVIIMKTKSWEALLAAQSNGWDLTKQDE